MTFQLAKSYTGNESLGEFAVSEKLDGVRAQYSDGVFTTRNGKVIHAPDWFAKGFPQQVLDGELWCGRGEFQKTVSIVRAHDSGTRWEDVTFMVFDLPQHGGEFHERLNAMRALAGRTRARQLAFVTFETVLSHGDLQSRLDEVMAAGGEGLMLQRLDAAYKGKRTSDLLKVKKMHDAEATVIGHLPGTGRCAHLLGALQCEGKGGVRFKVGTGFTDEERAAPPAIGTTITYSHQGLTNAGKPRFPAFVRVRQE